VTRHAEERAKRAAKHGRLLRLTGAVLPLLSLAACNGSGNGFVQIKTVPASSSVSQPALYFDSTRLEPLRNGEAVLTRKVGTTKVQAEGPGGQLTPLCDVVVKKNRITSVAVSIVERPPRCQCANSAPQASAGAPRTCVG
jgi:hypothetical protein